MVGSLLNDNSTYDEILTNIQGNFIILPGQFVLLDNQLVMLNSESLNITINDTKNKIFNYNINEMIVKRLKGELTYVVQLKLDNVTKFNVNQSDELDNLLTNLLHMKTPTTIYIIYSPNDNTFTIKNSQWGTLFIMKKIN